MFGYTLQDFIPFTAEAYLSLLARHNEALWPAQWFAMAMSIALFALLFSRRPPRIPLAILAVSWLASGLLFHLQLYRELMPAAPVFGWVFVAQAALLGITAAAPGIPVPPTRHPAARWFLLALAAAGLLLYPLLAPITGRPWTTAETFALFPDPTALAALAALPLLLRGWRLGLALPVPMLWLLISAATQWTLDWP